jgi:acyl-homoserine lactone acylase PvdQ
VGTALRIVLLLSAFRLLAPAIPAVNVSAAASLRDQVTIYRDRYGVPHIVGETEQATFFGYGYAQAEDHLEKMMLQFRDAQGRRSEILGDRVLGASLLVYHPEDYRWDGDYLQRLLRTHQTVDDNRAKIDPAVYQILDAFAQGVNAYIAEHRREIPGWIDHVSAEDVEALQRSNYMRYYSIADALSKIPGNPAPIPSLGSNHWAISPRKSASGRTMHVEEIHMPWDNRFQMYEAQLVTPGKLNAAGISWFGSPFFLCGFNPNITWSISYNRPNISDIYEETINPASSLEYLYDGQWRRITKRNATFRIKRSNGTFRTMILPLYYTHHGPVVRFDPVHHRAYSVKLPNFEGVNYSKGLYSLMKADSVSAFRSALARQLIPRWNFICTDKQHIYYVHNGVVARRDPKYNWLKPVPGWTSDTEWQGYLPFSANPQLLDPPSGFLQNSNNPAWVATRNSGIDPLQPVPYYYSYPVKAGAGEEALNSRGERVFGVLTRPKERFTLSQMISLALDNYILAADVIVPLIDKACARHREDTQLANAAAELHRWNRRAAKESVAFTYLFFWAKAYRDLYGDLFNRFNEYHRDNISIDSFWEQERAWSALRTGIANLQKTFGKTGVTWGQINRVVRNGSFPIDGNAIFEVLHPDGGSEQPDGQIFCDDGWGHMMVVEEGNPKRVWSLLPYGESEHPQSPHYNDMTKLHSEGRLKPFWMTAADILQNTETVWGDRDRILRASF